MGKLVGVFTEPCFTFCIQLQSFAEHLRLIYKIEQVFLSQILKLGIFKKLLTADIFSKFRIQLSKFLFKVNNQELSFHVRNLTKAKGFPKFLLIIIQLCLPCEERKLSLKMKIQFVTGCSLGKRETLMKIDKIKITGKPS